MTIQWFPGHMAKARREASEKIKLVDVVFELVDARLPLSSRNPMVDEIVGQKPRVVILNKADMADSGKTERWLRFFQAHGLKAVAVNSQAGKGLNEIVVAAKELVADKFEKMRAKGIRPRAIRAMIIGIPNVGKSTLINRLAKKNIAKTGNTPGVTKAQQWIKAGKELELLDTPGILWPKFEDQQVGYKLAVTGAVKDAILNFQDLAFFLLGFMVRAYPERLKQVYQLETIPEDFLQVIEAIGERRVVLGTGGVVDLDKTIEMLIHDVRTQKWGPLTFEVPEDFEEEVEL